MNLANTILPEIMDPHCFAHMPPNFPPQGPKSHTYCYYTYLDFQGIYSTVMACLLIVLFGLPTVLLTGEFIECINTNSFNELTETLCSILVKCLEQLTKATGETGFTIHFKRK